MSRLNLDEIQSGMVVASDILDRNGRILLKSGLSLSEKHLTILKQWGITDADIQGANREEVNAKALECLDQELLKKTEDEFQTVFLHADREQPVNRELFRLAVLRTARKQMGVATSAN